MRLRIQFKLTGKRSILPLNYQYPISAWIYKVLSSADDEFSQMLHENGYKTAEGKKFKLFTFSKLQFPNKTWKVIPKSDRMEVWSRNAYLTISFHLPEQTEKFVVGLFQNQKTFIGDKISGIEMQVENIEAIKTDIPNTESIILKSISSIVLGVDIKGEKNEQYVSPLHPEYKKLFLQNLADKYEAIGKNFISVKDLDFEVIKIHKNRKGDPKTELQKIKAFTSEQTEIRGHYFDFELKAPKEIIEIGLNSGFGSMNSLGFGFCKVIGVD